MNLKRIIREEINDFDWIDDIEPMRYYRVFVCQNMDYDDCWGGYHEWLTISKDSIDIWTPLNPPTGDDDVWVTHTDFIELSKYIRDNGLIEKLQDYETIYSISEISQEMYDEELHTMDNQIAKRRRLRREN
jgi:hypothetical protein